MPEGHRRYSNPPMIFRSVSHLLTHRVHGSDKLVYTNPNVNTHKWLDLAPLREAQFAALRFDDRYEACRAESMTASCAKTLLDDDAASRACRRSLDANARLTTRQAPRPSTIKGKTGTGTVKTKPNRHAGCRAQINHWFPYAITYRLRGRANHTVRCLTR